MEWLGLDRLCSSLEGNCCAVGRPGSERKDESSEWMKPQKPIIAAFGAVRSPGSKRVSISCDPEELRDARAEEDKRGLPATPLSQKPAFSPGMSQGRILPDQSSSNQDQPLQPQASTHSNDREAGTPPSLNARGYSSSSGATGSPNSPARNETAMNRRSSSEMKRQSSTSTRTKSASSSGSSISKSLSMVHKFNEMVKHVHEADAEKMRQARVFQASENHRQHSLRKSDKSNSISVAVKRAQGREAGKVWKNDNLIPATYAGRRVCSVGTALKRIPQIVTLCDQAECIKYLGVKSSKPQS